MYTVAIPVALAGRALSEKQLYYHDPEASQQVRKLMDSLMIISERIEISTAPLLLTKPGSSTDNTGSCRMSSE
jgi:hypothetical protein